MNAYVLAVLAGAIVLGMLTLVVLVVMGVIAVDLLWLLLPLSFDALAFWILAQLTKEM